MNVLSLFDGISCGQIALERAGIKVDNYFASEIKEAAIMVTQGNYPKVGSVEFVTGGMFANYKIDLLIGGSPCKGISGLNQNQEGLKHKESILFWLLFSLVLFRYNLFVHSCHTSNKFYCLLLVYRF